MRTLQENDVVSKVYKFAVVPKEEENPFYQAVLEGCMEYAGLLPNADCVFVGPTTVDAMEQASIVRGLIESREIDGISMAVVDEEIAGELAREAADAGLPFITFDSDAPLSSRILYVGTDNFEFGQSLAKVLLQLNPDGGTYGIIDASPPNVAQRSEGIRHRLLNTPWMESLDSPKDCQDSVPLSLQHMQDYASTPTLNAIFPVGAWPMRDSENWKAFVDANRNLTLCVGDTDPDQLDLLGKAYVDGLVGQVPYQMGSESIRLLLELASGQPVEEKTLFTTSLVEVIRVPISLPRVAVDDNQIEHLKIVGLSALGLVYLTALGFMLWTWYHRKKRVIKASQPVFLYMISAGVIVMASIILPLSVDDGWKNHTDRGCKIACMVTPWLFCVGFTTTFSALFAKTWRVNKIFKSKERFIRVQVSEKDVLVPFFLLLAGNIVVLSIWTALSPLDYVRKPHEGTDDWNRIISTYGHCTAVDGNSTPYVVVLGLMNLTVLVIANWQAYEARSIQGEFSESHYIGLVMASMLQSSVIGLPILFLVGDNPQAFYLVGVFMTFLTCMCILLFIFVPKVLFVRRYSRTNSSTKRELKRARSMPESHFYETRVDRVNRSASGVSRFDNSPGASEAAYENQSVGERSKSNSVENVDDSKGRVGVNGTDATVESAATSSGASRDVGTATKIGASTPSPSRPTRGDSGGDSEAGTTPTADRLYRRLRVDRITAEDSKVDIAPETPAGPAEQSPPGGST